MLEHCSEGETNDGLCIFPGVSFCIPTAAKDVNVHFFIHSFSSKYEIIMYNTLAVKTLPEFGEVLELLRINAKNNLTK